MLDRRASLAEERHGRAVPLRVLITVPWGERLGGAESLLWTLLQRTDQQRIQPTVVFFQAGGFEQEIAKLGIRTSVIPAGRLRNVRALVRTVHQLVELLRLARPDLIVNWSPKTQIYGGIAAIWGGMADRVVWWQHGVTAGHWMDRLATILPAQLVVSSSSVAMRAQASLWPHRPATFVYPGVEQPPLSMDGELAVLRRRINIPPGRIVLGTVGRLQPGKGQDHFLRTLASLKKRGHNIHGLVVGGDAYGLSPDFAARLRRYAVELEINDRVTFTGQVVAAGSYIQLMDVYVSASLGESFGIVIAEAMALNVPVVAFASGGPAEVIEHGRSGYLVPVGDDTALADYLERLVANPKLRREMAAAGYQRFRAAFSADRMAVEMERLFQRLCLN